GTARDRRSLAPGCPPAARRCRGYVCGGGASDADADVSTVPIGARGARTHDSRGRGAALMHARLAEAAAGGFMMAAPAAAFVPTDPLAAKQWYLAANHAYDAWPQSPTLAPVKIAVIDSGVDATHPELAKHIVAARSFVGGKATIDTQGHGTF